MLSDRKTICLIFLTAELALFICICDEVEEEDAEEAPDKKIHEMYEKQRRKKE